MSRPHESDLQKQMVDWARETLNSMGIRIQILGEPVADGPLILVGNHISYLDIPLLMYSSPNVAFLSKSEVEKWPVIGSGARTMGTVFVKRGNSKNRSSAKAQIAEQLQRRRCKIALFPSGTTSMNEGKPWRHGAFEIAAQLQIPIQPFRIHYSPLRPAAYIGRDFFPVHLYGLARTGGIDATIEFHEPYLVGDVAKTCQRSYDWSQSLNKKPGFVGRASQDLSSQQNFTDERK
ncbi:MAG: lysophospholipid acyltransferase family protein [Bdellovibrionales bacterium]